MKKIETRVWISLMTLLLSTMSVFAGGKDYYSKAIGHAVGSGTVYVSYNSKPTDNSRTSAQSGKDHQNSEPSHKYYFKATPSTNYKCLGWFTSETGGTRKSSEAEYDESVTANENVNNATINRYAIFYKFKPNVTTVDFGDVAYNSTSQSRWITVAYDNVDATKNRSALTGVLSASTLTDNTTNKVCSVEVTINPTTPGNVNQTLTISTTKAGQNINLNIPVKANVTATPSYTWNTSVWNANGTMKRDVYVGETLTNVVTTPSSGTKTYTIENWTPKGSNNTGATKPTFTDNTLYCTQAGTLTLRIAQEAETNGFNAGGSTINIEIKKNVPTVTWSTQLYYFNKNYKNVYTITAGDASLFSIESSDLDVATVNGTNLTTYYKPTSTTLTLTAVENYKWAGKVFTKSITPKDVPNHVPFTITSSNHSGFEGPKSNDVSWESNGYMLGDNGWTVQDDNFVIKFNGVPDKLTFDRHLDKWGLNLPETYLCQVFESEDGTNWSVNAVKVINEQTQDVYSGEVQLLPTTRYLKFTYHGTVYCHFNNIKVTELNDFYTNPTSIDFGTNNKIGIPRANETFTFHYANVGYKVNLSTNDSHFTVSPTSISTIGGEKAGSMDITVGYSTEEVHTSKNAKVTISDELGHNITVDLIGATDRKTQTIHWTEGYTTDEPSVVIGKIYTGVAAASTGYTVKYESTNEDIIEILDGGTSFRPKAEGTAIITAKQEGDPNWLPVSISKTFKTTNKTVQVIAWDQNLTRLRTTTVSVPLTAQVKLQNAVTGELTYSKERTDILIYESDNTNVVSISGHTLNIVGAGTATLTARVEGDDMYESALTTTPVVVKVPSINCEDELIGTDLTEEYEFFHMNVSSSMTKIVTINNSDQYPGSMTFQYRGVKWANVFLGGNIEVYESSDNSSWKYLGTITPSTSTLNSPSYPLSRNAKYIKFFRESSASGYHYISNIEITPAQYIESSNAEVNFGTVTVNSQDSRTMRVNYGNAKGELSIHVPEGMGLSVDPSSIDVDCGTTGYADLTIWYQPTSVVPLDENITISDAKSGKSLILHVTASASRATQFITWEPTATTLYTVDELSLNANASSGNTVVYEVKASSPENAVIISENVPSINTPGIVTIAASEPGDAIWEEAPSKEKEFTIQITPLHIETEPTLSANTLIYGQELSALTIENQGEVRDIRGNVVSGTWAWKTSSTVYGAGNYTPILVFSPSEHAAWYNELMTTSEIIVNKRTPEESELGVNVGAITYGKRIDEASLTNSGSLEGKWYWKDEDANKEVKAVDTYDNLNVYFVPNNTNYATVYSTVSVTVNQAEPSGYSASAANITVGQQVLNSIISNTGIAGDWTWVNPETTYNVANTYNVEARFTPENTNYYSVVTTLSLTVVPATNIFTNTAKNGDWYDPANWQSGIVPTSDPDIIVTGALEINEDITVHNLTIESTGSVAVISGGTLTVNGTSEDRTEYGDVHVMSDGALALGNSANLQVRDFTLDAALGNSSNAATSGQVSGDVNLHINRDAYFQMSFDPRGYITLGWYDMTVPFEVEVLNGVYDNYMNKLTNGVDYLVMSYDEVKRASSGNGWALFNGTMQPGRIYTITLDDAKTWNTFIFKKKSGSNLLSNGSCTAQYSSIGEAKDRGWNGLGNGTLQHRELAGLSGRKVQVYNFQEKIYEAFDADEKAYAVGTAFFVQADANMGTIDLTTTDGTKALRAPQYASRALDEFRLTLTAEGENRYTDRMWVSASEEATGEYVIGHDLLKMGTPKDAKVAQMWTVNNDLRLCDIEMPLMDDKAQCPISFFAPNALTYEIAVDQAPEDATLYLTYNDRIIWSLSASPYTIDLAKGMTEGYGLRIVARHNAPSVATGMDELNVDQDGNRKVLIDNMLYIITPEGAMYSVTGEKVK